MKKRFLSCLMAVALCLTLLPPAALAAEADPAAPAGETHSHPICGETCTDWTHTGNSLTWTGISSLNDINQTGNYYLTKDVTLSETWTCNDDVTLCLNGYSIKAEHSSPIITVAQGKTFTLTDCNSSKSSKHFKKDDSSGRWVQDDDGTITVNGGAVFHPGNKAGPGVNVPENGTFTMYGGTICGNSGGSGGNTEHILQGVDQLGQLQNGQTLNFLNESSDFFTSHCNDPPKLNSVLNEIYA